MNILQKINAVRKSIHGVSKDATVSMGKSGSYKATSHDGVISKIRPALVAEGIVFWVSDIEYEFQIVEVTNQYGTKQKSVINAKIEVTYANEEDPNDYITTFAIGSGEDFGDKATGKALSYAVKYCHLKTFALVTGLNDEERLPEYIPEVKMSDKIKACKTMPELQSLWSSLTQNEQTFYTILKDEKKLELEK